MYKYSIHTDRYMQQLHLKPASHWAIITESDGPQSVIQSDEICSDYFPPIVSVPLPDRRTKSNIGNRKLPLIVGPKSDMADYHRLPPIIIFLRCKFSHCPIFHPIFHPILRSVRQWDAGLSVYPIHTTVALNISLVPSSYPIITWPIILS